MKNEKTSLIERIMRLKSPYKNSIILYEYLISIILAGGLWGYFTINLGIYSYNLAKKYNFRINGLVQEYTYFGKYRDFSDFQWRYFRANFSFIGIFAVLFVTISQVIKRIVKNITVLKIYYAIIGIAFTYYLHGNKIIFLYIILGLSYSLCKFYNQLGPSLFSILTWVFCIAIKILSEIYHGFNLRSIGLGMLKQNELIGWNLCFGLNMLKMISYNMEYKFEKTNQNKDTTILMPKMHCKECCEMNYCLKCLKFTKCNEDNFTFLNLLIYIFYPPLYISGPIILFNSFMFQVNNFKENNHNKIFRKDKIVYFFRFLFDFFFFELFNHYIYVNCYFTNNANRYILDDKSNFDYFYLALFSFNNLTFLWLKFTVIWRTARVWAWFDGVFTEENMNRCVYNNYCFEEFWRAWHRSFNIWLIRYIYIPLGGTKKKVLNMWVVFSFVALWHDLKLNLLIWGWFICFFLVPEIGVKIYFNQKKFDYLHGQFLFRLLKYIFCSIYVLLMVIANLIGFGMGSEGLREITNKIIHMTSPMYFIKIILFLIPSTATMFYIRDRERVKLGSDKVKF